MLCMFRAEFGEFCPCLIDNILTISIQNSLINGCGRVLRLIFLILFCHVENISKTKTKQQQIAQTVSSLGPYYSLESTSDFLCKHKLQGIKRRHRVADPAVLLSDGSLEQRFSNCIEPLQAGVCPKIFQDTQLNEYYLCRTNKTSICSVTLLSSLFSLKFILDPLFSCFPFHC